MILALASLSVLVVLGAVQGATEFLPVSSSGHLVLWGAWLGAEHGSGLTLEIALHLGTLVAVMVFCRGDLLAMGRGRASAGTWRVVIAATAVTGALGLLLEDPIEAHMSTPLPAGAGLLTTALLLGLVAPARDDRLSRSLEDGGWRDGVVLGLFQSAALMPGLSRAGATIVAALLLGFRRPEAVRAAFLISVPAVAGVVALKALDGAMRDLLAEPSVMLGMLTAFLVGLAALGFVSVHVDARSLRRFALYCAAMGVAAILVAVVG